MIEKTDAVVLRSMKYRDTSKIARLYTRDFGRISVIAKGARDAKSKFRSVLEPMNFVSCVIYKNINRELQLLSQCDVLRSFSHLSEDMEKMYCAMAALELVDVAAREEERHEDLFELLLHHITVVDNATNSALIALYYFELKLSELLGFRPELEECTLCGKIVEEDVEAGKKFSIGHGLVCAQCSQNDEHALTISAGTLRVLQRLQKARTVDSIMNIHLVTAHKNELRATLRRHLQNHIEHFRGLKSEEVFSAIL